MDEIEKGHDDEFETGATGEVEDDELGETGETGEDDPDATADVEVARYRITGLVDIFDEQGVITGQFPVGSIQELPVAVGTKAVADGQAEAVGTDE